MSPVCARCCVRPLVLGICYLSELLVSICIFYMSMIKEDFFFSCVKFKNKRGGTNARVLTGESPAPPIHLHMTQIQFTSTKRDCSVCSLHTAAFISWCCIWPSHRTYWRMRGEEKLASCCIFAWSYFLEYPRTLEITFSYIPQTSKVCMKSSSSLLQLRIYFWSQWTFCYDRKVRSVEQHCTVFALRWLCHGLGEWVVVISNCRRLYGKTNYSYVSQESRPGLALRGWPEVDCIVGMWSWMVLADHHYGY